MSIPKGHQTIEKCRSCHNEKLELIKDLGIHFVSNFPSTKDHAEYPKAPLVLVFCDHCQLLQLKHTAPQEILYSQFYWYRSGVTESMKAALRDITQEIEDYNLLQEDDVVIDIGSNDGTLLRSYQQKSIRTIGIEPAKNLKDEGEKGIDLLINDFWNYKTLLQHCQQKAKVITAIGMFYDLDDPNDFIADIEKALSDDGVFIAQLMCNKNMIKTLDLGNINHEHLEYYSLDSLKFLFEKHSLEIIDITTQPVNNESYRITVKKKNGTFNPRSGAEERVALAFEDDRKYNSIHSFKRFFEQVDKAKRDCLSFIKEEKAKNKSVWVYGASTKGNTILQYYGLNNQLIDKAAERSPEKYGKYTVGTAIPIVSEEEARLESPDYFLVLPYTFIDEMYDREVEWRNKGGKFLIPLPEFKVLA
tara:strand:- start:76374 stop:77624 length:1251 start_codon:yes stop_codon:yes gene_type:complete